MRRDKGKAVHDVVESEKGTCSKHKRMQRSNGQPRSESRIGGGERGLERVEAATNIARVFEWNGLDEHTDERDVLTGCALIRRAVYTRLTGVQYGSANKPRHNRSVILLCNAARVSQRHTS